MGAIYVNRLDPDHDGISYAAANLLSRGQNILVFPEAKRVYRDVQTVGKLRRGVAALAAESGVPVVPLAIAGLSVEKDEHKKVVRRDARAPFGFGLPVVASFGEPLWIEPALQGSERLRLAHARYAAQQLQESMQQTLDRAYEIRKAAG